MLKHRFLRHVEIFTDDEKSEDKFLAACSKNSFYHPLNVKPRGDYLKKTPVDSKNITFSC
jgi:hypothetical protein